MRRRSLWLTALALVFAGMLQACREPDGGETFIRQDAGRDGVDSYTLPRTDTAAACGFWVYARTRRHTVENLQLNVQWLAPSGDAFSETVYMRSVGPRGSREAYRSEVVPAQAGDWQLSVRPVGAEEELLGWGVVYKKRDGTR